MMLGLQWNRKGQWRPRSLGGLAAGTAVLLVSGCGAVSHGDTAAKGGSRPASASSAISALPPITVWASRPNDPRLDAPMEARAGVGALATTLGSYTEAHALPGSHSSRPVLVASSVDGTSALLWLSPGGGTVLNRVVVAGYLQARASLVHNGVVYFQRGRSVEGITATGQITSYSLPRIPRAPDGGTFAGSARKDIVDPSAVNVQGLAADDSGRLFAVISNTLGAAVVDLNSGKLAALASYSSASGALVGADGSIYSLAWDYTSPAATIHLIRVDAGSLGVTGDWDTGLGTGADETVQVNDLTLLPSASSTLIFAAATSRPGADEVDVTLWRLDGANIVRVTSLANQGLYSAPGPGDSVYVYGGKGGSTVRRVDIATGAQSVEAPLQSPPDSDVVALIPA